MFYLNIIQVFISKEWQKLILWTLFVDDELIELSLEWTVIWLDREMQAGERGQLGRPPMAW